MTKHKDCHLFILFTVTFLFLFSNLIAQEKHQLFLKGLKAPVEVLRDEWGVNHIYAANQHDLFFAQGYCAAKDRLFQFEIWRRQATGSNIKLSTRAKRFRFLLMKLI